MFLRETKWIRTLVFCVVGQPRYEHAQWAPNGFLVYLRHMRGLMQRHYLDPYLINAPNIPVCIWIGFHSLSGRGLLYSSLFVLILFRVGGGAGANPS